MSRYSVLVVLRGLSYIKITVVVYYRKVFHSSKIDQRMYIADEFFEVSTIWPSYSTLESITNTGSSEYYRRSFHTNSYNLKKCRADVFHTHLDVVCFNRLQYWPSIHLWCLCFTYVLLKPFNVQLARAVLASLMTFHRTSYLSSSGTFHSKRSLYFQSLVSFDLKLNRWQARLQSYVYTGVFKNSKDDASYCGCYVYLWSQIRCIPNIFL